MKTLYKNARVLTMADGPIFNNANVLVEDNRITYVGKNECCADSVVDCKNLVLMPGLKNAHTHSAMVFLRHVGEGLPLQQWLEVIWKEEEKLTPEKVKEETKNCIKEYIQGGTTAFFDMYFFPPFIADAANEMGIRLTNLLMIENHPERIEMAAREYERWSDPDSLINIVCGLHAEYTIGDGLPNVKKAIDKFHSPCWTHISETQLEVDGSIERRGVTPTVWYENNDMFKYGGGGYHCIYLSDDDIEIFKKRNLFLVTCMGSNIKLKDGIAPLDKYLSKGLNIAIGTDGPASNESISMWREMSLVKQYFPSIDDYTILQMATVNASKAMNLLDVQTIEAGQKADFILVDSPSISSLVSSTKDNDVKKVVINGTVVFER